MLVSKEFYDRCKKVYPTWTALHKALECDSGIVGRYLDDASDETIGTEEILNATNLEDLKAHARLIREKEQLYSDYMDGSAYPIEYRKEKVICPRYYGQITKNTEILDAFKCYGTFDILPCAEARSTKCWEKFEELGFSL